MTEYIKRKYLDSGDKQGRKAAGIILSVMGMGFNLLLFILKYTAGTLSGSIAITADGFNNLADAGSCLLALLGFHLGDKKPDKRYPFGYGRLEYLSGLLISAAIIGIGGRMMISSVGKILHPDTVEGSLTVVLILLVSVTVKGYMYRYNSRIGRIIHSSGMRAAALDSLSDCFATVAILAAILIERVTGLHVDGYTGVLVALCILYAGITSVRECIAPLLGRRIDDETLHRLLAIADGVGELCIREPALHDYGPHKKLLTFYLISPQPEKDIPLLKQLIAKQLSMEAIICPIVKDFSNQKNKSAPTRQKYLQKESNTGA